MSVETEVPKTRLNRRVVVVVILLELLFCVAVVALVVHSREHHGPSSVESQRPAGIPASVSTSLANQMGLSPIAGSTERNFTLVDQLKRRVTLRALRGRVVVLQFMDSACTGVCPIAAQEVLDAYRDLGSRRADVDFVTVNVNRYAETVADVLAATRTQGLASVPTWHFVTGATASLKKIWYDYNVDVVDASPAAAVVHTAPIYFIAPNGKIGYLAATNVDYTAAGVAHLPAASIAQWGQGIAHVATSLLTN